MIRERPPIKRSAAGDKITEERQNSQCVVMSVR